MAGEPIVEPIVEPVVKPVEADKELKDKLDYLDKELKKVIKERDTAKGKLKEIDDKELIKKGDYEKILKEKEDLLSQKETELAEAKSKAEKFDLKVEADRKKLLEKIEDKDLKKIAEKLELEDLEIFAEKHSTEKPIGDGGGRYTPPKGKEKTTEQKISTLYKQ